MNQTLTRQIDTFLAFGDLVERPEAWPLGQDLRVSTQKEPREFIPAAPEAKRVSSDD
jgi:hypothetical protein